MENSFTPTPNATNTISTSYSTSNILLLSIAILLGGTVYIAANNSNYRGLLFGPTVVEKGKKLTPAAVKAILIARSENSSSSSGTNASSPSERGKGRTNNSSSGRLDPTALQRQQADPIKSPSKTIISSSVASTSAALIQGLSHIISSSITSRSEPMSSSDSHTPDSTLSLHVPEQSNSSGSSSAKDKKKKKKDVKGKGVDTSSSSASRSSSLSRVSKRGGDLSLGSMEIDPLVIITPGRSSIEDEQELTPTALPEPPRLVPFCDAQVQTSPPASPKTIPVTPTLTYDLHASFQSTPPPNRPDTPSSPSSFSTSSHGHLSPNPVLSPISSPHSGFTTSPAESSSNSTHSATRVNRKQARRNSSIIKSSAVVGMPKVQDESLLSTPHAHGSASPRKVVGMPKSTISPTSTSEHRPLLPTKNSSTDTQATLTQIPVTTVPTPTHFPRDYSPSSSSSPGLERRRLSVISTTPSSSISSPSATSYCHLSMTALPPNHRRPSPINTGNTTDDEAYWKLEAGRAEKAWNEESELHARGLGVAFNHRNNGSANVENWENGRGSGRNSAGNGSMNVYDSPNKNGEQYYNHSRASSTSLGFIPPLTNRSAPFPHMDNTVDYSGSSSPRYQQQQQQPNGPLSPYLQPQHPPGDHQTPNGSINSRPSSRHAIRPNNALFLQQHHQQQQQLQQAFLQSQGQVQAQQAQYQHALALQYQQTLAQAQLHQQQQQQLHQVQQQVAARRNSAAGGFPFTYSNNQMLPSPRGWNGNANQSQQEQLQQQQQQQQLVSRTPSSAATSPGSTTFPSLFHIPPYNSNNYQAFLASAAAAKLGGSKSSAMTNYLNAPNQSSSSRRNNSKNSSRRSSGVGGSERVSASGAGSNSSNAGSRGSPSSTTPSGVVHESTGWKVKVRTAEMDADRSGKELEIARWRLMVLEEDRITNEIEVSLHWDRVYDFTLLISLFSFANL